MNKIANDHEWTSVAKSECDFIYHLCRQWCWAIVYARLFMPCMFAWLAGSYWKCLFFYISKCLYERNNENSSNIILLSLLVPIILIKTSLPWMHPYHPHCILFHIHLDAIHQCVYARARVQFYNFKHENDISFIVLASVRFLGYYSIEQYRFKTIDKSLRLMMKYFPLEDSISIPK